MTSNLRGHVKKVAQVTAVPAVFVLLSTHVAASPVIQTAAAHDANAISQPAADVSKKDIVGFVVEISGQWNMSWNGPTLELHQGDAIPNSARLVPRSKDGSIVIGLVDINMERLRFSAADGPSAPITLESPPSGIDNWFAEAIENLTNNNSGWVDPISRSLEVQCRAHLLKALWLE